MKKLWRTGLAVLGLLTILWTADRIFPFLPDWTVRLNGVMMLAASAVLVFAGVRIALEKR